MQRERKGTLARLRGAVSVVGVGVALCVLTAWFWNAPTVRAVQEEHAEAPQSAREQGATAHRGYTGDAKCLNCHAGLTMQTATGMGEAAFDSKAAWPMDYSAMAYRDGHYTVTIAKNKDGLQMLASDGTASMAAPIRWIFGQGATGQTFILEQGGRFYESRASYYKSLANLDRTIGHSAKQPLSLMAALGRPLPNEEVEKCFSCHTSEDVFAGKLNLEKVHPGVTCESCHGAGSEHAMKMLSRPSGTKGVVDTAIFNPGKLLPVDLNDFCGSCHRTTRDVLNSGVRDIRNIRFQPYRLENSRCYDPSDKRITCVACHDPHRNLETSSASYDEKCLACHGNGVDKVKQHVAATCPRATKDCVTCHMPKLQLPGAHFAFTDHYIRVNQPKMPYPD